MRSLMELEDRHGSTAMFVAVRANRPSCLKVLISYRCNVLHRKKNGDTILHECSQHPLSAKCLHLLASYCGAELFQVANKNGMRAVDLAMQMQGDVRGAAGSDTLMAL